MNLDIHSLKVQANLRIGCDYNNIEMYSWPVIFPNTAGPHENSIGGDALTAFQVYGFVDTRTNKGVLYCEDVWKHVRKFQPLVNWV